MSLHTVFRHPIYALNLRFRPKELNINSCATCQIPIKMLTYMCQVYFHPLQISNHLQVTQFVQARPYLETVYRY